MRRIKVRSPDHAPGHAACVPAAARWALIGVCAAPERPLREEGAANTTPQRVGVYGMYAARAVPKAEAKKRRARSNGRWYI